MHAKTFLCLLAVTYSITIQAQLLNFRHFGLEEGLPNTNVWCVNQDAQGYLWVGTNQGFYRFNGLQFESDFGLDLHQHRIADILRISDSVLLAHSETPNMLYRIHSDQTRAIEPLDKPVVQSNRMATGNGDNSYYSWAEQRLSKHLDTSTVLIHLGPHHSRFFKAGRNMWVTGGRGIDLYQLDDEERVPFHPEVLASEEILSLFHDQSKDDLWVHTNKGFHVFGSADTHTFYDLALNNRFSGNDYLMDQSGRVWFCDISKGLHIFEPKEGRLLENNLTELLKDVQVTCLFMDIHGTIWIGTGGYGLYQVPTGFVSSLDVTNGLPGLSVTHIAASDNPDMIVIGTNSGLGYVNRNLKRSVHPMELGLAAQELQRLSGYVTCMDRWSRFVIYSQSPGNIRGGIVECGEDRFWLSHAASVCSGRSDVLVTGAWGRIRVFPQGHEYLPHNRSIIKQLIMPRKARVNAMDILRDTIWAASSDGLIRLNLADTSLAVVSMEASNDTGLIHCSDLLIDGLDRLWVATRSGVYCRTGSAWRKYTRQDGLSSEICTSLAWDGQSLWVGSYQGVNRLNGERFESASLQSGLISAEVSTLHYDSSYRTLWLGTVRGLSYFNIDEWKPEQASSNLWLSDLEIMDDTIIVSMDSAVALDYDQNNIRFSIELLDLWGARNTTIHYRLIGASREWAIAAKPEVEFFGLAPGQYTLEVKTSSPLGSSEIASASFQIDAPFWSTWWFALSTLLAITTIIALFARTRIRQVRFDERRQRITFQRMFQLEQQALAAAMNPHFIFNALHSIQELFTRHGDAQAIDYVGELAQLMRKNLESVTQKEVLLADEIEQVKRYLQLEKVRFGERLKYNIAVSNELLAQNPAIPAMLIQPFIENALKHGIAKSEKQGKVSVGFREIEDMLEIAIIDNGVGLKQSQSNKLGSDHVSRGINIVRKRLALHSYRNQLEMKQLHDAEGLPIGTQVTLKIDLSVQPSEQVDPKSNS